MRECPDCGERWPSNAEECPDDGAPLSPHGHGSPLVGRFIGSYRVTRRIGRGGMGAVFEAEHPAIGSRVAVKLLHRRYSADRAIVERFFNEARAVNVIGHDNIVDIVDFNRLEDGRPYLVMEFLDGKPLSGLADAPQPLAVTGPLFLQVADALQAAHEKGIVHRDLKPDNIFLVTRNRRSHFVKIVDFGIAKLRGNTSGAGRTQTGMVMGTAQYMSPEQAAGEVNRIGPQSDVYSLGVLMFRLATGRLPFDGESFGEILVGHISRPPPSLRLLHPDVPAEYEALVLRCLEKRPEDRFASMEELYDELDSLLVKLGLPREPPLVRSDRRGIENRRPCFGSGLTHPDHLSRGDERFRSSPPSTLESTSALAPPPPVHRSREASETEVVGKKARESRESENAGFDTVHLAERTTESGGGIGSVPISRSDPFAPDRSSHSGPSSRPARSEEPDHDTSTRSVSPSISRDVVPDAVIDPSAGFIDDEPLFAFDAAAPPSHIDAFLDARRAGGHRPGSGARIIDTPSVHPIPTSRSESHRQKPDRGPPSSRRRSSSTLLLDDGNGDDRAPISGASWPFHPSRRSPIPVTPSTSVASESRLPFRPARRRKQSRRLPTTVVTAVAATAFVGLGLGAFLAIQKLRHPTSTGSAAVATPPDTVSLRVSSDPSGARLLVVQGDDEQEFVTPSTLRLIPRVTATLTVSAEGYGSVERPVVPREGLELHLVLSRDALRKQNGRTEPEVLRSRSRRPSGADSRVTPSAVSRESGARSSRQAERTSASTAAGDRVSPSPDSRSGVVGARTDRTTTEPPPSSARHGSPSETGQDSDKRRRPVVLGDGLVEVDL